MCSLFGLIDYSDTLSYILKKKIIRTLSVKCEVRGTDATGIAYIKGNGSMKIIKKALPAHKIKFKICNDNPKVIMGHTRLTTQGTQLLNYNNHPFYSDKLGYSLAHNGIIYNDIAIRKDEKLPKTKIETDSYIAVQLIDSMNALNEESISNMVDKVRGSYCFTILSKDNELYIVKGDNPICIAKFEGYYVYASTESILKEAFKELDLEPNEYITPEDGTLIIFKPNNEIINTTFNYHDPYYSNEYFAFDDPYDAYGISYDFSENSSRLNNYDKYSHNSETMRLYREYYEDLVSYSKSLGYDEEIIEYLYMQGFDLIDIENMLCSGEDLYDLIL